MKALQRGRRLGEWRAWGRTEAAVAEHVPCTMHLMAPSQYLRWYIDGVLLYEINKQALVAQTNGTGGLGPAEDAAAQCSCCCACCGAVQRFHPHQRHCHACHDCAGS